MDIAVAMNADGVHVGQSDMEAGDVRAKLGPDKIIGVSTQTVEQAILAEKHGADYLGVGAVFPTTSKDDAAEVSYDTLKAICEAVSIPVVAIGGITQENVVKLTGSGIDGVAVISAIYAQKDIKKAAGAVPGVVPVVKTGEKIVEVGHKTNVILQDGFKSKGIDKETYIAVIAMALKQYADDVHDVESGIITIKPHTTIWGEHSAGTPIPDVHHKA